MIVRLLPIPSFLYRTARTAFVLTALCCLLVHSAQAQTPTYSYVNGSSSNVFPMASTTNMVQWLMMPSYFPTAPAGNISTIYIKPSTSATNATYTNFTVKMGNTSLTAMASGPFITGLSTVYTQATQVFPTVTANGWVQINLQTPFYYSGTSNFILEISQTAYSNGFNLVQDNGIANARLYGTVTGGTGTTASGLVNFGFDVSAANCSGTPSAPTITTAALANPVCSTAQTITATYPSATSGGITYQWEQAPAASGPWTSVTTGTGATTLSYTTAPVTASTWYRVRAICSTSNLSTPSAVYAIPVATPQPDPIAGSTTFCPGNAQVYSVTNSSIPATYAWTLPTGWTGNSNAYFIPVTTNGSAGGTISVTATTACGTSIPRTLAVTLGTAPAQPGAITGNTTVCAGATQRYSIAAVPGADTYTWTLPNGWTGTSNTNSINVTPGTAGGNIAVKAVNNCGSSSLQTLAVGVTTQPLAVGPILGDSAVCPGTAKLYRVIRVPNALYYTWTTPSSYLGTSTTDSLMLYAIPGSGQISVTAVNGCAGAVPVTQNITVLPALVPSVSVSATSTSICSGSSVTFTPAPVNGGTAPAYQWMKNGVQVATTPTYTAANLVNGDQVSVTMSSSYLCPTLASVSSNSLRMMVTQSVAPGININNNSGQSAVCSGTPVTFTANVTGGGTAPSYQWMRNNTLVGGNGPSYTLSTPVDGDSIYAVLTSNIACATQSAVSSNKIGLNVQQMVVPAVRVTASPGTNVQRGQVVTFTAIPTNGGASPTYQWYKNTVAIGGANGSVYTTADLKDGDQIGVQLTSSNVCASPLSAGSNKLVISMPTTGVGSLSGLKGALQLAPNPNNGHFTMSGDWDGTMTGKEIRVEVVNAIGQVIYAGRDRVSAGRWNADIALPQVPAGLYLLQISTGNEKTVKRFEVMK